MIEGTLLKSITYAIAFLLIVIISIIVFIVKSRVDRQHIDREKRKAEEILIQKTVLLKEIHHRVKNNLQLVSGLLYLQSKKYKNPEVQEMLNDIQKRINSIALVHEMLYKEKTLTMVSMESYVYKLSSNILSLSESIGITLDFGIKNIFLPEKTATTLGLILNELITNSIKYAFKEEQGVIFIGIEEIETNEFRLIYKDNGVGMELDNAMKKKTLGQKLIKMFSEEMDAVLTVKNQNGLLHELNFKID